MTSVPSSFSVGRDWPAEERIRSGGFWPSAARPLSVEAGTKRTFVQGTWNVVMRNREGVEAKKGARQYAEPLFAHNKSVQLCGENATAATMPATTTVRTSGQATCRQFPMNVCSIISILFGSNVRILSIMGRTVRRSCRAVHIRDAGLLLIGQPNRARLTALGPELAQSWREPASTGRLPSRTRGSIWQSTACSCHQLLRGSRRNCR